ncbi:MAG TPA: hypothetical protein VGQ53_14595 [Chitinophagaceae bacterium]|jgi:hypothetical protein|nr:hypothetical protein [Chitinophagaceae bacterium]
MRPFEVLDTADLINVLATYTARYTKMLTGDGKEKDLINCEETIRALITEIELRKRSGISDDPSGKRR